MKATELRIGNLVIYEQTTHYITLVDNLGCIETRWINQLINESDYICSIGTIKPIPLTEEWLLKFGFKKDTWTDNGLIIGSWWNNGSILITDDFKLDGQEQMKSLQYVHQLQNLYFALVGEELTFKSE